MAARRRPSRSPIEKDPNRPLIERALAMGISVKRVSERYNHSVAAIKRYRERMPQQLKAAIVGASLKPGVDDLEKLRTDEAAGLLGNLAHQRARLLLMQDVGMEEGSGELVARLSGVIHKNLEMVGRFLGLFANFNVNTNVNVLISEDYLRLRQALVLALRPYPDARHAVSEALHRIEGEVAQKMLAPPAVQGVVLDLPAPRPVGRPPYKAARASASAGTTAAPNGAIRLQRPTI
jgi:hypothetical protein